MQKIWKDLTTRMRVSPTKPHHPEVALLMSECIKFFEEDSATYTNVSFTLFFYCVIVIVLLNSIFQVHHMDVP